MADEKVIDRLRKLIEHEKSARNIGSVEEAKVFAARIQEIMFRHKVEMTDVEYAAEAENEPVAHEFMTEDELTGIRRGSSRKAQGWVDILVEAITRANFCRAVKTPRQGNSYHIFGKETDRLAAKALFKYLYDACMEAAPQQTAAYVESERFALDSDGWTTPATLKARFTKGFKVGFAAAIAQRLKVQNQQLKAGAGEHGLIRIDQLEKAVENKRDEMFAHLRSGSKVRTRNRTGFAAGHRYGSAVGINSHKRLTQ